MYSVENVSMQLDFYFVMLNHPTRFGSGSGKLTQNLGIHICIRTFFLLDIYKKCCYSYLLKKIGLGSKMFLMEVFKLSMKKKKCF